MAGQGPSPIRRGVTPNTPPFSNISNSDLARRLSRGFPHNESPTTLLEDLNSIDLDSNSDSDLASARSSPRRDSGWFSWLPGWAGREPSHQSSSNNEGKMPKRSHQRVPSTQNKDHLTGNCITCGSLVRWPKTVQEFRCTICETINDLAPLQSREHTVSQPDTGMFVDFKPDVVIKY